MGFFKHLSSLFLSGDAQDEMLSKREEHVQPITEQTKEYDERYFSIILKLNSQSLGWEVWSMLYVFGED